MAHNQPRLLLLGPPGAGKGTQASNIAAAYDVDHITTGDALRANKDMDTEHGTPREYMEKGELVPDPVVNEIVEAAIAEADGFVLDGYPRNLSQAAYLDDITDLDFIGVLDVPREELVARLTGRRVCAACGATYHVEFNPPAEPGVCDECGGDLIQRDDDTKETVQERLAVFEENTKPVIEHYAAQDYFARIDGEATPEEVWSRLQTAIEDAL